MRATVTPPLVTTTYGTDVKARADSELGDRRAC
jgi:hypothetical protein